MLTSYICFAEPVAQPEDTAKATEAAAEPTEEVIELPVVNFSEAVTPIILDSSSLNPPEITARAAVVMDARTGTIIYTKNEHEKLYPASLTKIMTAILALELTEDLSVPVTATIQALAPITSEDSHIGILVGEELTMDTLISGLLVASANDAANVIAIHTAGSVDKFAELMNKKAESLGAYNTHFENASGVHDDNHYTTAYDMSIIAQYAMQNEKFREYVKQTAFNFPVTNKHQTPQVVSSTNLFLSAARSSHHVWKPAIGVKTGHTSAAGYCLVTAAQNGGNELISVVLKCPNTDNASGAYSFIDSKSLLNFGFNNYKYMTLAKANEVMQSSKVQEAKDDTRVSMTISKDVASLLPKSVDIKKDITIEYEVPETFKAPIKKGDALGTVSFIYQDQEIAYTTLIAGNDVELNALLFLYNGIIGIVTNPIVIILLILVIAVIVLRIRNKRLKEKRIRKSRLNNRQERKENPKKQYKEYTGADNQNSRYRK